MMLSTMSTCFFKKIFTNNTKVICFFPWLKQNHQFAQLSYCMSVNPNTRLKQEIYTQEKPIQTTRMPIPTTKIMTCQKMNLHHLSPQKWLTPKESIFTNITPYQKINLDTVSLNNKFKLFRCWSSSTDDKPTALMVISDLKQLKTAPLPALGLGFSGLIPFVSAPMYMMMTSTYIPDLSYAQTAYGAVILSFLGGVRWGHAVGDSNPLSLNWTSLGQSVMPSLIAWPALLMPLPISTLVVAGGLGGLAYYDIVSSNYEPWFKALRFVLSFVAVIALWSSIMCYLLLTSPNNQTKTSEKKP